MARKSIYEQWKADGELDDKLLLISAWARNGLVQEQICNNLGISRETLNQYKHKYKAFHDALKKGKEVVDIEVENALYKRAVGYKELAEKAKVLPSGKVVRYEEDIIYPPDVTAQIYWLKNRNQKDWRDRREIDTGQETLMKVNELLASIKSKDKA